MVNLFRARRAMRLSVWWVCTLLMLLAEKDRLVHAQSLACAAVMHVDPPGSPTQSITCAGVEELVIDDAEVGSITLTSSPQLRRFHVTGTSRIGRLTLTDVATIGDGTASILLSTAARTVQPIEVTMTRVNLQRCSMTVKDALLGAVTMTNCGFNGSQVLLQQCHLGGLLRVAANLDTGASFVVNDSTAAAAFSFASTTLTKSSLLSLLSVTASWRGCAFPMLQLSPMTADHDAMVTIANVSAFLTGDCLAGDLVSAMGLSLQSRASLRIANCTFDGAGMSQITSLSMPMQMADTAAWSISSTRFLYWPTALTASVGDHGWLFVNNTVSGVVRLRYLDSHASLAPWLVSASLAMSIVLVGTGLPRRVGDGDAWPALVELAAFTATGDLSASVWVLDGWKVHRIALALTMHGSTVRMVRSDVAGGVAGAFQMTGSLFNRSSFAMEDCTFGAYGMMSFADVTFLDDSRLSFANVHIREGGCKTPILDMSRTLLSVDATHRFENVSWHYNSDCAQGSFVSYSRAQVAPSAMIIFLNNTFDGYGASSASTTAIELPVMTQWSVTGCTFAWVATALQATIVEAYQWSYRDNTFIPLGQRPVAVSLAFEEDGASSASLDAFFATHGPMILTIAGSRIPQRVCLRMLEHIDVTIVGAVGLVNASWFVVNSTVDNLRLSAPIVNSSVAFTNVEFIPGLLRGLLVTGPIISSQLRLVASVFRGYDMAVFRNARFTDSIFSVVNATFHVGGCIPSVIDLRSSVIGGASRHEFVNTSIFYNTGCATGALIDYFSAALRDNASLVIAGCVFGGILRGGTMTSINLPNTFPGDDAAWSVTNSTSGWTATAVSAIVSNQRWRFANNAFSGSRVIVCTNSSVVLDALLLDREFPVSFYVEGTSPPIELTARNIRLGDVAVRGGRAVLAAATWTFVNVTITSFQFVATQIVGSTVSFTDCAISATVLAFGMPQSALVNSTISFTNGSMTNWYTSTVINVVDATFYNTSFFLQSVFIGVGSCNPPLLFHNAELSGGAVHSFVSVSVVYNTDCASGAMLGYVGGRMATSTLQMVDCRFTVEGSARLTAITFPKFIGPNVTIIIANSTFACSAGAKVFTFERQDPSVRPPVGDFVLVNVRFPPGAGGASTVVGFTSALTPNAIDIDIPTSAIVEWDAVPTQSASDWVAVASCVVAGSATERHLKSTLGFSVSGACDLSWWPGARDCVFSGGDSDAVGLGNDPTGPLEFKCPPVLAIGPPSSHVFVVIYPESDVPHTNVGYLPEDCSASNEGLRVDIGEASTPSASSTAVLQYTASSPSVSPTITVDEEDAPITTEVPPTASGKPASSMPDDTVTTIASSTTQRSSTSLATSIHPVSDSTISTSRGTTAAGGNPSTGVPTSDIALLVGATSDTMVTARVASDVAGAGLAVAAIVTPSALAANKATAMGRTLRLYACPSASDLADLSDASFVFARGSSWQPSATAALFSTFAAQLLALALAMALPHRRVLQTLYIATTSYYGPNVVALASSVLSSADATLSDRAGAGAALASIVTQCGLLLVVTLKFSGILPLPLSSSEGSQPQPPTVTVLHQRFVVVLTPLLDGLRRPEAPSCRVYGALDVAVAVASAAVAGARYNGNSRCGVAAVALVVLAALQLGYLVAVRPLSSPVDAFFSVVNQLSAIALSAVAAATVWTAVNPQLDAAMFYLSAAVSTLLYVQLVAELGLAAAVRCGLRSVGAKQASGDEASPAKEDAARGPTEMTDVVLTVPLLEKPADAPIRNPLHLNRADPAA